MPPSSAARSPLVAVCSSVGNLLNSRLVRGVPLVRLIRLALTLAILTAGLALALAVTGIGGVWLLVLAIGLFFTAFGLVVANGSTLALQPHAAARGRRRGRAGIQPDRGAGPDRRHRRRPLRRHRGADGRDDSRPVRPVLAGRRRGPAPIRTME